MGVKQWIVVYAAVFGGTFLTVATINQVTAAPRAQAVTVASTGPVACHQEDGSGSDQAYPCVWDARAHTSTWTGYPVTIYFEGSHGPCPVPAGTTAVCVDVDGWTTPGDAP